MALMVAGTQGERRAEAQLAEGTLAAEGAAVQVTTGEAALRGMALWAAAAAMVTEEHSEVASTAERLVEMGTGR